MNGVPLISIIVPVYKVEQYIRECINSILNQKFADFELILVDDGSPDRCPQICDEYHQLDARVKVIHKSNAGVSAARNDGLRNATGKFVAFVDSDDLLPVDALEKYIDYLDNNDCDAVFGKHVQSYEGKQVCRELRLKAGRHTYQDIKDKVIDDGTLTGFLFGSVCGALYRREVLNNNSAFFNESVRVNEDGLFNFCFLSKCRSIYVIDEFVYIYRQWKYNSKKSKELCRDERFDACEKALAVILGTEYDSYFQQLQRRKISITFWNAIRIQESDCKWQSAKAYLINILSAEDLDAAFDSLDYKEMSIYKRILCSKLKNKRLLSFYILVKYFVPIAKKYIKR